MTGASDFRIMRSHLLPHLVAPIIVYSTLIIASNIIAEAGLSFLGLGIKQPTASWGNLLAAAPDYYLTQPWLMVWPGLVHPPYDPRFQSARRRSAGCVRPSRPDLGRVFREQRLTNGGRLRHTSHAGVFLETTLLPCGAARQGEGFRERKRKESYAQEAGALPIYARHGSCVARRGVVRRRRFFGHEEAGLGGGAQGRHAEAQREQWGLRLRRSSARLSHRRLGDALHDLDEPRRLPGEVGRRRRSALSGRRHVVPDRVEGRQDLHVPHPSGPEVLGRLAGHRGRVPACLGARAEPEDGLAGRREHRRSGPDRRRCRVPRRQGPAHRRHQGEWPEPDVPPHAAERDVRVDPRDDVVHRHQAERGVQRERSQHVPVGRPVLHLFA